MHSKADPVRRNKFKYTPRAPMLRVDRVAPRKTQVDVLQAMKEHRVRRDRKAPACLTIQCTFTLTPELDAEIHARAQAMNVSRSAVVRQALLHYLSF